MRVLTNADIDEAAREVAERITVERRERPTALYGVPRGGIPAAYAVARHMYGAIVTDTEEEADAIIDDLIDSGATSRRYTKPFYALFDKRKDTKQKWYVFPWEQTAGHSAEDVITRLLQYIGEDPQRGGLQETPARVLRAWRHWASGYKQDPTAILKVFEDGAERVDEMVIVRDIPVYSHCEHHLAPFFGVAHVAYVPNGKIVGLSKISRLVDVYARRLQVQERLTNQIADALDEHLDPVGVGVVIECRHMCMESRGIQRQGAATITSALRGAIKDQHDTRAEFMGLIQ